jgi:Predicted membrane protein
MNKKVNEMMIIALLSALAFVVVATLKIPTFVPFLSYEPKDVIITTGGFLMGPLSVFFMSVVVSFIEMITISSTGPIGFIMNVLSTCAFAGVAAWIYSKKRTYLGAIQGLIAGVLMMTVIMIMWNYLITPIYLKIPREAVVDMILPYFLPFNLMKGAINTVIILMVYHSVFLPLFKRFNFVEGAKDNKKSEITMLVGIFVLVTVVLFVFVLVRTL